MAVVGKNFGTYSPVVFRFNDLPRELKTGLPPLYLRGFLSSFGTDERAGDA